MSSTGSSNMQVRNSKAFGISSVKGCHSLAVKSCHYLGCNYKTLLAGDMKKHIRKHTGERPYQCNYCSYKATQKGALKSHIICKHKQMLL